MSEYKVGDKVKIVDERPTNPTFGWSGGMDQFLGKVVTIGTTFKKGDCDGYTLVENPDTEDGIGYKWSNEMIAGLVEETPVMKTTESLLESLHKERADIEVKIKRIGRMIASGQLSAYDNDLLAIQQRAYKTVSLTLSVRINKIARGNKEKTAVEPKWNVRVPGNAGEFFHRGLLGDLCCSSAAGNEYEDQQFTQAQIKEYHLGNFPKELVKID